jgi:hypothetical protein
VEVRVVAADGFVTGFVHGFGVRAVPNRFLPYSLLRSAMG